MAISRSFLMSFSSYKSHLPKTTFKHIRRLDICRTKPTHRGSPILRKLHSLFKISPSSPLHSQNSSKAALLNVHSLTPKSSFIHDYVLDNQLNFLALTETWLHSDGSDLSSRSLSTPSGYQFLDNPRPTRRGGGVAIICSTNHNPTIQRTASYSTFELLVVRLSLPSLHNIAIVYRPRDDNRDLFTKEIGDLLCFLSSLTIPFIILGDFNIKVNVPSAFTTSFLNLLDMFNLIQHVSSPTHRLGNTLDLIISSSPIDSLSVLDLSSAISDHFLLQFKTPFLKNPSPSKKPSPSGTYQQ